MLSDRGVIYINLSYSDICVDLKRVLLDCRVGLYEKSFNFVTSAPLRTRRDSFLTHDEPVVCCVRAGIKMPQFLSYNAQK